MKWIKIIEEIAFLFAIVALLVAVGAILSGCSGNSPSFEVLGEENDAGDCIDTDQESNETDGESDQSQEDTESEQTDQDTDTETECDTEQKCTCKPEQDLNFSCDVFNDLNPPHLVHNWALDDHCTEGEICCQPSDVVGDYCLDLNRQCVTGFDKCAVPDLEGYCYTSGNVCCKE